VSFSPAHDDVFATGGSDGTFVVWDVFKKMRLRTFPKVSGPVTALAFSRDGMALAYTIGYDWAKGYQHSSAGADKKIVVHCFAEAPKKK
jgi:mRNA export factor